MPRRCGPHNATGNVPLIMKISGSVSNPAHGISSAGWGGRGEDPSHQRNRPDRFYQNKDFNENICRKKEISQDSVKINTLISCFSHFKVEMNSIETLAGFYFSY